MTPGDKRHALEATSEMVLPPRGNGPDGLRPGAMLGQYRLMEIPSKEHSFLPTVCFLLLWHRPLRLLPDPVNGFCAAISFCETPLAPCCPAY